MKIRSTGRGTLGVILTLLGLFALIGCSSTPSDRLSDTAVHSVAATAAPRPTSAMATSTTQTTILATTTSAIPETTLTTTSPSTAPLALPQRPIPAAPPIDAPLAVPPQLSTTPVIDCGPGYYTNSNGSCVHDPTAAPEAPSGATALCGDGTYSFSQHRSGTCSHHGGVQRWL